MSWEAEPEIVAYYEESARKARETGVILYPPPGTTYKSVPLGPLLYSVANGLADSLDEAVERGRW